MRASAEIVIERPVEAVWEWAADPRNWHRWQEGVGEVRFPGGPRAGVRFAAALEHGGEAEERSYEIVERTPPRRQVVRSVDESAAGFYEGTLELSEDVRGTRVRQTMDSHPEDALERFLFAVAAPLVRLSARRRIAAQLARLKEMTELGAAL
ncbi:MAG TPA: SRPBCC family protein [Thermoleophilaceae bacterium]|nr:SRPBCC family protein [Thermoleophilaceae bacterium]